MIIDALLDIPARIPADVEFVGEHDSPQDAPEVLARPDVPGETNS